MTQVTDFHLQKKEANRLLKVKWKNSDLDNTATLSTSVSQLTMCTQLKGAHSEHSEGGYINQPSEETGKLQMGNKRKYNQNNCIGFMLLDRRICSPSMVTIKTYTLTGA